ncbi:DUF221-domain-containing protein [Ophiobolus disseminans]|uniref:DUF221-domain-containing protein n=1 Tax=Ophiobolus disseminans TaxID=1469910 RepID=A0A6A6ZAF1_9PLEO|nr:DUF221-domain-containing protein [Ophiobolus disseminans]
MDLVLNKSFLKVQQLSGASLSTFMASISISTLVFALEVLIFLVIRKRLPDIYPPLPEASKTALRDWKKSVVKTFLRLDRNDGHFDRYFLRRYIRTLIIIFLPASLIITPVLLPLNYVHGKSAALGVSGLDTLGWSNVGLDHSDRFWVHLLFSLLFIAHVCWIVWSELAYYVAVRQSSPHAALRTVLIDSIPEDWLTKRELAAQLEVFPGEITAISFNRNFSPLSHLVARRERLARSLEVAETHYIRKAFKAGIKKPGRRPSIRRDLMRPPPPSQNLRGLLAWTKFGKVDTIVLYRDELRKVNEEIENSRATPERFPQLPSAFITFENPLAAHMVCQAVIHTKSGYMTPRILPLSVHDVVWDNICIPWWNRYIRTVVSNVLIATTALLCIIPAAFAGLLSQIIYITYAVTWLSWINDLLLWSLGLLQGVLPPTILIVFVKGYSTVLEYLVRKQGMSSRSSISLKIQDLYFCFLFVQTTLVVSLSAGITTITNEIGSGISLAATLAKNLPKASNYFLSYVLLQALSASASSILRIDCLIGKFILAPILDKTVTRKMERIRHQDVQWGTFVPFYTNLSCIGFLYAIITPIILLLQVLILAVFWVTYSNSSVLLTERDNGGLFYPNALKHLLIGLYVMEVSLVALFLLIRDSRGNAKCVGQACFVALAAVLTAVYHYLLCKAFNPLLTFSPTALKDTLIVDPTPQSFLHHTALDSSSAIRLPHEDGGISSKEVREIREELRGVAVSDEDATLNESGNIRLRTKSMCDLG